LTKKRFERYVFLAIFVKKAGFLRGRRYESDWLGWLRFFLEGVQQTAQQATDTTGLILRLFDEDRRKGGSAQRVLGLLRRHPITTIPNAAAELHLTAPTVRSAVENLEALGIVREITGKQRDRIYLYDQYVRILDKGTEPLPR
jgi:Fic family protein